MSAFYFDVWPADDIAGTALGELTQAFDRQIRAADQALGKGQFSINRHDSQYTDGWCAQDNMVRVRLEAGGPFDYDDPRYIFAFFIEESQDVALSPDEEGGEIVTRGGRDAVSILRRAVIYPTSQHADDTKKWAQVPKTGNVVLTNLGPGEAMRVFLRNAVLRSPNPLAPSTHDFNVNTDSSGNAWTDSDTDWQFPVGKDYLTLLSDFVAGGVFFRMGPDLVLHCYEDHPGVDLSGSITISKGVDLREAADKQIYASEAMSRAIVKGTRKNNTLQFVEVVDAGVETAIGRREGGVDYQSVATTARLTRAGQTAINKAKRQYDGPTTGGTLDGTGKTAFVDFLPGDSITLDIPGVYDTDVVRVAAISLQETEAGEYDPILEFEASPFDPSTLDGFVETGNTSGSTKPNCGDCPEPEPFNPDTESSSAHAVLYFPSEGASYPPEINFAGTGDAPPSGFPGAPKAGPIDYATGGVTGYPYTAFDITGDINGATLELLMSCAGAYAATTVTLTWTIRKNGSAIATATQSRTFGEFAEYWSPSQLLTVTGVTLANGDTITAELAISGWSGSPPVVPGGIATSEYLRINGTAVVADPTDTPLAGQWVIEQPASDGSTALLKTNYPYTPYSIEVHVSGVREEVIQTDPTAGEWTLPIVPPAGTQIIVRYQVGSTTATGATNSYLPSTAPSVVTRVLLGNGSDGSGDNVLHDDGTWRPAVGGGGSTDCCGDNVAPQDRASGSIARGLSSPGSPSLIQSETGRADSGVLTVTLPAAPTPTKLLMVWLWARGGSIHSIAPVGFTLVDEYDASPFYLWVGYRIVQTGDGDSVSTNGTFVGGMRMIVAEFDGLDAPDATTKSILTPTYSADHSISPTGSGAVAGIFLHNTDITGRETHISSPSTLIEEGAVDAPGNGPYGSVGWRSIAPLTAHSGNTTFHDLAYIVSNLPEDSGAAEWAIDEPETIDGDDATYDTITGSEILRLDLGASYGIVRSRLRIACATSGARTYTITGANEADFSDGVVLDTAAFTAIGSNTAQDVEFLWVFAGQFRYFQLDGDNETRRIHSWELYEASATDIIVTDPTTGAASDLQGALDGLRERDQWKQPVRVATTANITIATALNAGDSIDGVTLAAGDRVLVKDQSTGSQNGIYIAGASPTRAADMDADDEVVGAMVHVVDGTANGGKVYRNTNLATPTIGSTSLTFTALSTGGGSVPDGTDPGDLLVWDGAAWDVLPIGADDLVLKADSGEALGVRWATDATGGGGADDPVADVFGTPTTAFEFDTTSLTGLTAYSPTPDVVDIDTTIPGHLYIKDNASGVARCGYYASAPSAPFTAICKISDGNVRSDYHQIGLAIGQATPGTMNSIQWSTAARKVETEVQTPTGFTSALANALSDIQTPLYLAILVNSSTDVDFLYSYGGRIWAYLTEARNPSFTIGSVGVWFASNNTNGGAAAFDFLRIWDSAKSFPGVY